MSTHCSQCRFYCPVAPPRVLGYEAALARLCLVFGAGCRAVPDVHLNVAQLSSRSELRQLYIRPRHRSSHSIMIDSFGVETFLKVFCVLWGTFGGMARYYCTTSIISVIPSNISTRRKHYVTSWYSLDDGRSFFRCYSSMVFLLLIDIQIVIKACPSLIAGQALMFSGIMMLHR